MLSEIDKQYLKAIPVIFVGVLLLMIFVVWLPLLVKMSNSDSLNGCAQYMEKKEVSHKHRI